MKEKAFFLVSQVLSFRHTKQISKNVAGTTFNLLNIHTIVFKIYNAIVFWFFSEKKKKINKQEKRRGVPIRAGGGRGGGRRWRLAWEEGWKVFQKKNW